MNSIRFLFFIAVAIFSCLPIFSMDINIKHAAQKALSLRKEHDQLKLEFAELSVKCKQLELAHKKTVEDYNNRETEILKIFTDAEAKAKKLRDDNNRLERENSQFREQLRKAQEELATKK